MTPVSNEPTLLDRICHKEQLGVWADELASALALSDFLKEDWTFDDSVDLSKEIAAQLRDIIGAALTHPEFNVTEALAARQSPEPSALSPTMSQAGTGEEVEVVAWLWKNEPHGELVASGPNDVHPASAEPLVRLSDYQALKEELREARMQTLSAYGEAEALSARLSAVEGAATFQDRVAEAHIALFHDDPTDLAERRDRFYEEATETAQSLGMTEDEAHQLVSYTFSRPPGDVRKEIGAAVLTLASACVVGGWDMMACAEADLAALRTPEKIAKVRAKRATRHGRGPLPGIDPALTTITGGDDV